MTEVDVEELKSLLRLCYGKIPGDRLGRSRLVEYDPAGSTYDFIEHDWSIRVRKILDITYEPTGL